MIAAVIFDMDGLLVDSEPYWRIAETKIFGNLSVAPAEADFEKMMGRQINEVIQYWYQMHPWENYSLAHTQKQILSEVEKLVIENSVLLPGVLEIISFLKNKNISIALASSSPTSLINGIIKHFGIFDQFEIICSAEFEKFGKPHPAVFLTTAKLLKVNAESCLVLEDSYNGVLAAKAAQMKCIAVPCKEHFSQTRFDIADLKLNSLQEFSPHHWEILCK